MPSPLVSIADYAIEKLNSAPNGTWSSKTVGTAPTDFVKARFVLDPAVAMESGTEGLYVIPVMNKPDMGKSQGRGKKFSINQNPIINIALVLPFKTADSQNGIDVSTESEIKEVLNLKDEIDFYLASMDWQSLGMTLEDIEPLPAQEVDLARRWFVGVSELSFEGQRCPSNT